MKKQAIVVENIYKEFKMGELGRVHDTLRDKIAAYYQGAISKVNRSKSYVLNQHNTSTDIHHALADVSFSVAEGEAVGLVGANGAGKSTLLKILSQVMEPSRGRCIIRGRVASLLEVGTGFNPELTGRENVYINGVLLGMKRAEIVRKFDEIVGFAGVEKYIDTPVKRYSSGMQVRLAFAVAAHLEPEIMLVDEVLAVGDAGFQKKCLARLDNSATEGRTVLFVSHNMEAIASLCSRAVWLEHGKVKKVGEAAQIVKQYLEEVFTELENQGNDLSLRSDRKGNGDLRINKIELREQGRTVDYLTIGETVQLVFHYSSAVSNLERIQVWCVLRDESGRDIVAYDSRITDEDFETIPGRGVFICNIPKLGLLPGNYVMRVFVNVKNARADQLENAMLVKVRPGYFFPSGKTPIEGVFCSEYCWEAHSN